MFNYLCLRNYVIVVQPKIKLHSRIVGLYLAVAPTLIEIPSFPPNRAAGHSKGLRKRTGDAAVGTCLPCVRERRERSPRPPPTSESHHLCRPVCKIVVCEETKCNVTEEQKSYPSLSLVHRVSVARSPPTSGEERDSTVSVCGCRAENREAAIFFMVTTTTQCSKKKTTTRKCVKSC